VQFYIVLNGSCHIFQGAYHPKSPVVDNLESGDVFGTQLMLRQRPSPFTIRLMEPSEFLIVSEDSYRVIMNCGGGSVRRVDIRSWRTDFESNLESSIFKSCPPSFKRKLSSFVTFRHIDQHTNLNLTDGLHFLLLDGSVSLHRRLEGKHLRGATPPLLSEKERSKVGERSVKRKRKKSPLTLPQPQPQPRPQPQLQPIRICRTAG